MLRMFRTLYSILMPRERWLFIRVLITVLIMALLEVVSIGAIVPFMGLLTQPEMVEHNRWLNLAYTTLGFTEPQRFLIFAGACLLGIFLFKNAFATFAVWLQLKFSWGVFYSLSARLVTKYLNMPYTFFLTQNTSELEKNLVMEVGNTIMGMVQPAINMVTHGIIALAILGLLFYSDPVLAVVIFVILGGAYAAIYFAVQKKLTRAGADRVQANKERFKAFHESFGGVKDLKVMHREDYFINSFLGPLGRFRDHTITHSLISQTPRFAIEALAFGGLLAIVLYIVGVREDFSQVIPFASLYAMAGYRMLPSLQQVMAALTSLRFYEKSVNVVKEDLRADQALQQIMRDKAQDAAALIPLRSHIRMADVSYKYPNHSELAVDGISLKIDKNQSVALVGRSGAGKSTLADILLGLLSPSKGQFLIDDTVIDTSNIRGWQKNIGFVPQQIFLIDNSVTKNIAYGLAENEIDMDAVHHAAKVANIFDFVDDLPDGFETLVGERGVRLSGGQRQRIAIARALYHDPSVLIFDEATSALDGETETAISQSIQDLTGKKTLILIAHRLQTVKDCDVIYLFDNGKLIAQGGYDELMQENEQFQKLAQGDR